MSHATPLKPNRIQQTLRRYFLRILPRPLTLVEDCLLYTSPSPRD